MDCLQQSYTVKDETTWSVAYCNLLYYYYICVKLRHLKFISIVFGHHMRLIFTSASLFSPLQCNPCVLGKKVLHETNTSAHNNFDKSWYFSYFEVYWLYSTDRPRNWRNRICLYVLLSRKAQRPFRDTHWHNSVFTVNHKHI